MCCLPSVPYPPGAGGRMVAIFLLLFCSSQIHCSLPPRAARRSTDKSTQAQGANSLEFVGRVSICVPALPVKRGGPQSQLSYSHSGCWVQHGARPGGRWPSCPGAASRGVLVVVLDVPRSRRPESYAETAVRVGMSVIETGEPCSSAEASSMSSSFILDE